MGHLFGGAPSVPSPAPLPPAALPATLANPQVALSGAQQRIAAAAASGAGFAGTLQNQGGAQGLVPQNTGTRSLLGG